VILVTNIVTRHNSKLYRKMTHSKTRREEQRSYLLNHADPRPLNFFSRFKYRSSSNAHQEYGLRLNQALQEAPDSKKLLNLRRKWDNDEYRDDWACYKDSLEDRKANVRSCFFYLS